MRDLLEVAYVLEATAQLVTPSPAFKLAARCRLMASIEVPAPTRSVSSGPRIVNSLRSWSLRLGAASAAIAFAGVATDKLCVI